MKFLVITHVEHKLISGQYYAYSPYVKEINLWLQYVSEVIVIAPLANCDITGPIDLAYDHPSLKFIPVPAFNLNSWKSRFITIFQFPSIFLTVIRQMKKTDHIHLRCPGNMGLIGCLGQLFFPSKPKTVKYAGNWDPKSPQPFTYQIQRRILRSQLLTHNIKVLVYGNWDSENKNLKPFFTASYRQEEIKESRARCLDLPLKFIFVGSLVEGKNPMISCEVVKLLNIKGIPAELHLYGEGSERMRIETMIQNQSLHSKIILHGNVNAESLKKAYLESHFLLFASKSEGWPKAVAEAMFWACLPITTRISCVPDMIGNGSRGILINPKARQIVDSIIELLESPEEYRQKAEKAMIWSRTYTIEKFQSEIKNLLKN